jgi:hypothetical protein
MLPASTIPAFIRINFNFSVSVKFFSISLTIFNRVQANPRREKESGKGVTVYLLQF